MRCRLRGTPPDPDLDEAYTDFLVQKKRLCLPDEVTMFVLHGAGLPMQKQSSRYLTTLFGAQVRDWPDDDNQVPWVCFPAENGRGAVEFVFPLIRVNLPGVPATLEARWFRDDEWTRHFPTLEVIAWAAVPKPGDLADLMAGVEILRPALHKRGRKRADVEAQVEEFLADLPSNIRKARLRDDGRLVKATLAEMYGYSEDSLDDRMRKANLTMNDLKRRRGAYTPR
jgi:hypothetical protein